VPTQNTLLGAAGEHYVLSCLLRQGYTAGFAPPGTPAIDIMVYDDLCQVHRNIQVKTRNPNRPDGAWMMGRKHETPLAGLFFCLVAFPKAESGQHDVYVMPSDVIAAALSLDHRQWLSLPGRKGQVRQDNEVRVLLPDYTRRGGQMAQEYGPGWLEPYRNRWDLLKLDQRVATSVAAPEQ
jgi:hypothetical protein